MPTYVYKFLDTGETIEVQQAFSDATLSEYPHPSDGGGPSSEEGVLAGGRHLQGRRLLQDRQPRRVADLGVQLDVQQLGRQLELVGQLVGLGELLRIIRLRIIRLRIVRLRIVRLRFVQLRFVQLDAGFRRLVGCFVGPSVAPRPVRVGPVLAEIGVLGGSGFYEFLDDVTEVTPDTPYGPAAAPITIGTLAGRRVAFLPRHGRDHQFVAHRVPFRANVWAMWSLGVRSLVAPCSVGSLQPDLHPGEFVVIDQVVDRTWGRPDTYHDDPPVHHQTFADPYDPAIRAALLDAGRLVGATMHDGGTMVVINGPRFSTRAESSWFRSMGWHVVNMTGYPEAVLAAELDLPYATIALVTDYDAGVDGHEPVTMDAVFAVMRANVAKVRELISAAVPHLP